MYLAFEVLTVVIVACAMALAFAHALELPGKLRLDELGYRTVQTIYYPGFTLGGAAEPAAMLATFLLLLTKPLGSTPFWLMLFGLAALTFMQLIFWLMTQPVNRHWLRETQITDSAKRFFGTEDAEADALRHLGWAGLRDRWELSHVLRAIAGMVGLVFVTTAIAL
ncbi:MAG: hypothetical protein K0R27_2352 [Xanthobacteraceae bacterium]|jgi:hypothetical protein|nr:hypothetical protein [Xanthobacteraceae bacterium]